MGGWTGKKSNVSRWINLQQRGRSRQLYWKEAFGQREGTSLPFVKGKTIVFYWYKLILVLERVFIICNLICSDSLAMIETLEANLLTNSGGNIITFWHLPQCHINSSSHKLKVIWMLISSGWSGQAMTRHVVVFFFFFILELKLVEVCWTLSLSII